MIVLMVILEEAGVAPAPDPAPGSQASVECWAVFADAAGPEGYAARYPQWEARLYELVEAAFGAFEAEQWRGWDQNAVFRILRAEVLAAKGAGQ